MVRNTAKLTMAQRMQLQDCPFFIRSLRAQPLAAQSPTAGRRSPASSLPWALNFTACPQQCSVHANLPHIAGNES